MAPLIDLHCHTTFSDGSLTPAALLDHALNTGVRVLAITDHDTIQAYGAIREQACRRGVVLLCGVEMSTHLEGFERSVHLLGYFPAEPEAAFSDWLLHLQQGRAKRNTELLTRLQQLGLKIEWDEVSALAQRQVGRPHFAQVLLRKGYVATMKEAFTRYLGEGGLAWVERDEPTLASAIENVQSAGGMASLAHPVRISHDRQFVDRVVADHAPLGLEALECFHSEHSEEDVQFMLSLAHKYGLNATGGSDFHGNPKPEVDLGTGRGGNVRVPWYVAEQLARKFSELSASISPERSTALRIADEQS
ncbi:MAG TPA: PHP domain-containing protein [Silvibacterium sp.]|nr:PHP domain-containing protein [Silvibacterium sp.]